MVMNKKTTSLTAAIAAASLIAGAGIASGAERRVIGTAGNGDSIVFVDDSAERGISKTGEIKSTPKVRSATLAGEGYHLSKMQKMGNDYTVAGDNFDVCAENLVFGVPTAVGKTLKGLAQIITLSPLEGLKSIGGGIKEVLELPTEALCTVYNGTLAHVMPEGVNYGVNGFTAALQNGMTLEAGRDLLTGQSTNVALDGIYGVLGVITDYAIGNAIHEATNGGSGEAAAGGPVCPAGKVLLGGSCI